MNQASSIFLIAAATLFLFAFGLPLLLAPMVWARRIGWKIPEDTDLADYLGRSLGGVALPIVIMGYFAAADPWAYRFIFNLIILIGIFMVGVHFYGFVRKKQPMIENLEIIIYLGLVLLAWLFYPKPPH